MKRIYIAGKLTNGNQYKPSLNDIAKFKNKELELQKNWIVINPIDMFAENTVLPYDFIIDICKDVISGCDAIYMLSDYKDSKGAKIELEHALKCNLEVVYE